jgi:hypothetical protein
VGPRAGLNGCGKFAYTGIRSLDRPFRSEVLYRAVAILSYPSRAYSLPHLGGELVGPAPPSR